MVISRTDLAILLIRIAATVPLVVFLLDQARHRFQNGITKLVRRMTFYLVLAQLLLLFNLVAIRATLIGTGDPRNFGMNAVSIVVGLIQIAATVYAWRVFRKIHTDCP